MHARWLVDVAALLAYHVPAMAEQAKPLSRDAINRYWIASRQRIDQWNKTLHEYRECLDETGASYRSLIWRQLQSTMEEVFLSDVLVRTMCAVTKYLEAKTIDLDSYAIAASVFAGQEDSRNRCLHLMTTGVGQPLEISIRLNRVRQSMETWSDNLVSMIDEPTSVSTFSFTKAPIDLAEQDDPLRTRQRKLRWQFMISGCQQWISQNCTSISANPEQNESIHRAAFSLLQPDWMDLLDYDSVNIVSSERLVTRLQNMLESACSDEFDIALTL